MAGRLILRSTAAAGGGGGGGTIYAQENWSGITANTSTLTADLTSRGFDDLTDPGQVTILARASLPAGLTGDANFPAGKTRAARFDLSGNETQARLRWPILVGLDLRTVWLSWWEYRPNANEGGEKLCRFGNFCPADGNQRGLDNIITYGADPAEIGYISNHTSSANALCEQNNVEVATGVSLGSSAWMHHLECGVHLSTGLGSDGWTEFWVDGTRVLNIPSMAHFKSGGLPSTTTIDVWDVGGWSSDAAGTYPITRYICELRIASQRQGVWAMANV